MIEVTYPRRAEWALDDYAVAIERRLLEHGVAQGWVIGESFSSQVAWALAGRERLQEASTRFALLGLILVGGFVRHPWPWGVQLASAASRVVPLWLLRRLCSGYGKLAGRKHRACPEVIAELGEFVQRRTADGDREAINGRYRLIAASDLRDLAKATNLPVFQLTGALDPIVPWWQVRPWLKKHCPGYCATRVFWRAGHNVLLSAPQESADQILAWIQDEADATKKRRPG